MPQYRESTWTSAKKAKELNDNRSGSLLDFLEDFTERFPKYHAEYHTLLTDNRIWKQRLVHVGIVSPERAMQLGFTPRMRIVHTSSHAIGQIYLPAINWMLMVACTGLVLICPYCSVFCSGSAISALTGGEGITAMRTRAVPV